MRSLTKAAKRKGRYWWVAEYKCGCSADADRRADLLDYCAKHGDDRRRITKLARDRATDS